MRAVASFLHHDHDGLPSSVSQYKYCTTKNVLNSSRADVRKQANQNVCRRHKSLGSVRNFTYNLCKNTTLAIISIFLCLQQ